MTNPTKKELIDLLTILELTDDITTLTDDKIRQQYRKLSLQYHPDRNRHRDTQEDFKKIANAHEELLKIGAENLTTFLAAAQDDDVYCHDIAHDLDDDMNLPLPRVIDGFIYYLFGAYATYYQLLREIRNLREDENSSYGNAVLLLLRLALIIKTIDSGEAVTPTAPNESALFNNALSQYVQNVRKKSYTPIPTVINKYATFDDVTKKYLLNDSFCLNANNYSAYELMWVYTMLSTGKILIVGNFKFTVPEQANDEQKLLLYLIQEQLAYPKFSQKIINDYFVIYLVILYALLLSVFTALYCLIITQVLQALYFTLGLPSIILLGSELIEWLSTIVAGAPIVVFFTEFLTLISWMALNVTYYLGFGPDCDFDQKIKDNTIDNIKEAFKTKVLSAEADLKPTPKPESVIDMVCNLWNSFTQNNSSNDNNLPADESVNQAPTHSI